MKQANDDLKVITKSKELAIHTLRVTSNPKRFPKKYRFSLCAKMQDKSWLAKKYGRLNPDTYKDDLKQGFNECFRVLKPNGILVFKWNETDVTVNEIIKLAPYSPLFGHKSGKLNKTHWIVFMKNEEMELKENG